VQGDKQRTLAVEALGNNNKVVGVEDFTRAHDGVQGAETRVIKHDILRVYPGGNQILAHGDRLVVALLGIVAAQQQVVHLAAVVGVQRTLNAVAIVLINDSGAVILSSTQHDPNLAIGQILQIVVDPRRGFPAYPAVKNKRS